MMENPSVQSCSKKLDEENEKQTRMKVHMMHLKSISDAMTNDWNQLTSSLPLSIALLGDLTTTAAVIEKEFAVKESSPSPKRHRFRFLRHPECFRLLVWRIIHVSQAAFNMAHTSMDEIAKLTVEISDSVKEIPSFATSPDIRRTVQIGRLESSLLPLARGCYRAARDSRTAFQSLSSLVEEVMDVCDATKSPEELYKVQREASNEALNVKSSHVQKELEDLTRKTPHLKKYYSEALDSYNKAVNEKPHWSFYLLVCLIEKFTSFFTFFRGACSGETTVKLMSSLYDDELESVSNSLREEAKNLRENTRRLASLREMDSKLKTGQLRMKLEMTTGFTVIDPEPALELLEKAHSQLGSFIKLTTQLMDYFELLLEILHVGQEPGELINQISPILQTCAFVHDITSALCGVWKDQFVRSFRQMESLIEEEDLSSDPDKTLAIHNEFHDAAQTASQLLKSCCTHHHHQHQI